MGRSTVLDSPFWGVVGSGLLAIHLALLLLPPIPPLVFHPRDSLWSYLIGYGAMLALAVELRRQRSRIVPWWATIAPPRRLVVGAAAVLAAAAAMFGLRALAPRTFDRFSSEAGIWEPASLLCYLGSALILFPANRNTTPRAHRRHWQFIAALYAILALEELDYFSVFGGRIGRIRGVYVGSLHDLIALTAKGGLHLAAAAVIGAMGLAAGVGFWRTGYLQPKRLAQMLRGSQVGWLMSGLVLLAIAAAHEVHLLFPCATGLEEPLDFLGALCLAVYALDVAASSHSRPRPA